MKEPQMSEVLRIVAEQLFAKNFITLKTFEKIVDVTAAKAE